MANTYTLISSNVLASATTTVTFSSIPQTYTDLVLRASVRTSRSNYLDELMTQFNGDTATNYSATVVTGNAAATATSQVSNNTSTRFISVDASTAMANTFSNTEIYIPNYTGTANKPISASTVVENNDANNYMVRAVANLYRGSSAITSITFQSYSDPGVFTFLTGSSFYLYGIKNS
jgi:hypothetical protein